MFEAITPFLTKTTAIMTAVIILIMIGAWLVSTEKKINRGTVEKYINTIKISVISLILLEVFLTLIDQ
jgi:preprotein translocase subunit SecG